MAYGNEDDFNRKLKEDETPFQSYTITLSERDLTALSNLKDRNGAGMTVGCPTENIAIWKIIDQICETNTHEKEWTCRFCGKLQPASATGRWKTIHAPMDCGGKNANVPPPLRTVTYCPAHMKSWLVTAHRTMSTQVIFSHLLSRAKPIFGADKTSAGRSGQASSSTTSPAPPPKKRSAGDRRKDQLAKRITLSNKTKLKTRAKTKGNTKAWRASVRTSAP